MRAIGRFVFTGVAILATAGVAQAGPVSFSDTFDPADFLFGDINPGTAACTGNNATDTVTFSGLSATTCESLTYTHSIMPPYNPLTDTLSVATLSIYVYDNTPTDQPADKIDYSLDLGALLGTIPDGFVPFLPNVNGTTAGAPFIASLSVLGQITVDGTLNVILTQKAGDLYFARSVLTAEGRQEDEDTPTVPEPATLALVGLAAAGAAMRRKRMV